MLKTMSLPMTAETDTGRQTFQHEKPIALALTLFITSLLSSCEVVRRSRPGPNQNRIATLRDATR